LKEFTINYKEDVWKTPADTYTLFVKCGLSMHMANEIVMRCRELHRLVIDGHAYFLTGQDVKDFLNENVHVEIVGHVKTQGVAPETEKKIRELYSMGHKNITQLSLDFKLDYDTVKQIIDGR